MGYSLIEMMITLVIMSVLASMGLPALEQTSSQVQLQLVSQRWLLALKQHQQQAMSANQSVVFAINAFAAEQLPSGWQVHHNYSAQAPLVFSGPQGYAKAGTIQLSNAKIGIHIVISSLGRIRQCLAWGHSALDIPAC